MSLLNSRPLPGTAPDPMYPSSDGREMGESTLHTAALVLLLQAMEDLFAARGVADTFVGMQLLLYFQQGNPSGRRDPDLMVGLGAGSHARLSWRVWEEGRPPDVVFEFSSESTVDQDTGAKRDLYELLGIPEYFLFDPHGYLTPPLQGRRLAGGAYQPIQANADGSLDSAELIARLLPEADMLRVIDLTTGAPVPTRLERAERAHQEAADLRAEVARLRGRLGLPPQGP